MNGFVYAIGDGEGRVKIGWSGDPLRRLIEISVGCAGEARLLGVIEATRDQETEAHRLLARWRTNGEWFRLEGPVQAFVDMLPAPRPHAVMASAAQGPMEYIRRNILGVSQITFAKIAAVTQGTVSRWENGEFEPGLREMARIRAEAISRNIPWDDRWFFEVPTAVTP